MNPIEIKLQNEALEDLVRKEIELVYYLGQF